MKKNKASTWVPLSRVTHTLFDPQHNSKQVLNKKSLFEKGSGLKGLSDVECYKASKLA